MKFHPTLVDWALFIGVTITWISFVLACIAHAIYHFDENKRRNYRETTSTLHGGGMFLRR